MAMSKIDRIDREIEKTRGKITEYQNRLKELEAQRTEQENFEIVKQYETLSMQEKIGVIAQAFGCTSGTIETSPCTGKWRGTSDISIRFDNGSSLFLGNHMTRKAKTKKVQQELVDSALVRYNPKIIRVAKETAYTALKERELQDNAIAAEKGLKPYTLLNVEFNDGADQQSSGYIGWYYATLAVDGKICTHLETGLNHDIASGSVSPTPTRENYYAAGALKESDVDYVFNKPITNTTPRTKAGKTLCCTTRVRKRGRRTRPSVKRFSPSLYRICGCIAISPSRSAPLRICWKMEKI